MFYIYFFFIYILSLYIYFFFFFNDTATTEIYTLSLHDALPISRGRRARRRLDQGQDRLRAGGQELQDRKSTRLNSSHSQISYAVFCLKKKKKNTYIIYLSAITKYTCLHTTVLTQSKNDCIILDN